MGDSKLSTKQQIDSIWALGGLSPWRLAVRVWNGALAEDLLGRASELAYNFIFAVFPLMLFLLALFGLFAGRGTLLRSNLMLYLQTGLPPAAFQVISQTIAEVTRHSSSSKLTFGIILTLWFASGGTNSMISALNAVYKVRESRPLWKVRGIALALTVAIAAMVVFALAVVLVGGIAANWVGAHAHLGAGIVISWHLLQWPISILFVVFSYSLIYYFGPDLEEQHWYWITPGSLFGVLLWLAVTFGFRMYLHFFNSYSKTYGSLGAVMILLFWFYVTGLAFLAGGEINAQIEHAAAERGHPEAKAVGEKKAA
jgi:membrane protein